MVGLCVCVCVCMCALERRVNDGKSARPERRAEWTEMTKEENLHIQTQDKERRLALSLVHMLACCVKPYMPNKGTKTQNPAQPRGEEVREETWASMCLF